MRRGAASGDPGRREGRSAPPRPDRPAARRAAGGRVAAAATVTSAVRCRGGRRRRERPRRWPPARCSPSPPAERAGGVGGLHGEDLARAEAHDRPAGPAAGQVGGVVDAEHVAGLLAILHPQRDAERHVGADALADHARRALGGQDQVHAEAAPRWATSTSESTKSGSSAASAANSSTMTTRRGQPAVWPVRGRRRRKPAQVVDAGLAQAGLPAAELRLEAAQRPGGERFVEIGDDADRVRQPAAHVEGGAALVVDEDEVELAGVDGGGQPGDPRAQQLALARPGGARHEGVGPVGHEIDGERSVLGRAQRRRQRSRPVRGRPSGEELVDVGGVVLQQLREADRARQPAVEVRLVAVDVAGQPAGEVGGAGCGEAGDEHRPAARTISGRPRPTLGAHRPDDRCGAVAAGRCRATSRSSTTTEQLAGRRSTPAVTTMPATGPA